MAAVSSHCLAPILFSLLCLPSVSSLSPPSVYSLSFNFNLSQPGSCCFNHSDLHVFYLNSTHPHSEDGPANASVDPKTEMIGNGIGQVSYARPVPLWDEATGEVASFSMSMTVCLQSVTSKNSTDARMAIFLAPYQPTILPPMSNGVNRSNANATTSKDQTMEVEFHSYLQDKLENGRRSRTISVDVNYIVSMVQVNMTAPSNALNQSSAGCAVMIVQIDYDGGRKMLDISLRIGDVSHHINASVDLSKTMPKEASIGFRSTTDQPIELHNVLFWSFNSTLGHTNSTVTVTPPEIGSRQVNSWHLWKQSLLYLDQWNWCAELNFQFQIQRIWERINLVISSSFNVTLAYGIPR